MHTEIHWIQNDSAVVGKLGVMPRPRGEDWLQDEIEHMKKVGVDVVVCLLESDEAKELGLVEEESICRSLGIVYWSFPIPDYSIPKSSTAAKEFCAEVASELKAGKTVVVHCRQGIGRSGIIAAGILAACGFALKEAIERLSAARGCRIPETEEQLRFVLDEMPPNHLR